MSAESSPSGDRPLLLVTDDLSRLLQLFATNKDQEALAQILERTQKPFTAYARKLCAYVGLPRDYDELVYQIATIKMTQTAKRNRFDFSRPLVPWLRRVEERTTIDIYRSEKKRRGTRSLSLLARDEEGDQSCAYFDEPAASLSDDPVACAEINEIVQAVDQLPLLEREMILAKIIGCKREEIARTFESTTRQVSQVLTSARNRLRISLNRSFGITLRGATA